MSWSGKLKIPNPILGAYWLALVDQYGHETKRRRMNVEGSLGGPQIDANGVDWWEPGAELITFDELRARLASSKDA